MTTTNKLIIGIVGPLASGKGAVADFFRRRFGSISITLSYFVHEELEKRGRKEYTRQNLQDLGNELRERFGNQVLAQKAMEKIEKEERNPIIVIEGIRNPAEVKYLEQQKHFYLISVNADSKIRFSRLTFRRKPWDPKTWKAFMKISRRDLGTGEKDSGQQVRKCMQMAHFSIVNNRDLAHIYKQMDRVIFRIKRKDPLARKLLNGVGNRSQ